MDLLKVYVCVNADDVADYVCSNCAKFLKASLAGRPLPGSAGGIPAMYCM